MLKLKVAVSKKNIEEAHEKVRLCFYRNRHCAVSNRLHELVNIPLIISEVGEIRMCESTTDTHNARWYKSPTPDQAAEIIYSFDEGRDEPGEFVLDIPDDLYHLLTVEGEQNLVDA